MCEERHLVLVFLVQRVSFKSVDFPYFVNFVVFHFYTVLLGFSPLLYTLEDTP